MDELEGLRDARISDVFYFFEELTSLVSGRTVGRKIGIVQEVILRWYLEEDDELRRRMFLEQSLEGASGARHKVEFSWFPIRSFTVHLSEEIPETQGLLVSAIDPAIERVRVSGPWGGSGVWLSLARSAGPLRRHLDEHAFDIRAYPIDERTVIVDVIDKSRLLASLESKRVGAQRFAGSDKLGSGIQTIEKAKQASLVAIDLDLRHNQSIKPLRGPGPAQLLSVVALGNGVHWTSKDRSVLGTYVDVTYLVRDSAIIRYAEYVQELAGEDVDFLEYFMSYFQGMTKQDRDAFEVLDSDFEIVAPASESRSLRQVLRDHLLSVNPSR